MQSLKKHNIKTILLSRTDAIGDLILSLPMIEYIKNQIPYAKIIFLAQDYTKDILDICNNLDQSLSWTDLQKMNRTEQLQLIKSLNIDLAIHIFPNKNIAKLCAQAKIPLRLGSAKRWYHFLYCNLRPNLSRKHSTLHESQLNLQLLNKTFKEFEDLPSLAKIFDLIKVKAPQTLNIKNILQKFNNKKIIILHPGSRKSAVDWPIENYLELAKSMQSHSHLHFIMTGSPAEKDLFSPHLNEFHSSNFTNLMGQLKLKELIELISHSDAIVACSTGPLHIAGIFNKYCYGIFCERRPIHSGRWSPLGHHTRIISNPQKHQKNCNCVLKITPQTLNQKIQQDFQ